MISNVPVEASKKKLKQIFTKYGKVYSVRFRTNSNQKIHNVKNQNLKNIIAYIAYDNIKSAESSTKLHGTKIGNNIIRVTIPSKKIESDPKRTVFVANLKYGKSNFPK